jgi:D-threo-aldose 1-dehydrogenase
MTQDALTGMVPDKQSVSRPWQRLGRSDVMVPALGIGTVPLGDMVGPISDDQARKVVTAAHSLGARLYDTAPQYGLGLAERRLGSVLPALPRDEFVVISKVGRLLRRTSSLSKLRTTIADARSRGPAGVARLGRNAVRGAKRLARRPTTARLGYPLERGDAALDAVFDFSYDGARHSIAESLARLGLERLDVVLLHDPDEHQEEALAGAHRALSELKGSGELGAVGIGTNRVDPLLRMLGDAEFDCVLLAGRYTLLDHASVGPLLSECEQRRVSLIIGGVFNSGMLADPRPGQLYDYQQQRAGSAWLERALRLKAVCERHGVPLAAAAIQFPLGHPSVATVLCGVRSADELAQNVELFSWPIPRELWADLRAEGLVDEGVPLPGDLRSR